jgi:hypothetical protein
MKIFNIPLLWGTCSLKSSLSLEELADKISSKLFCGLKFSGKEFCIHEEIPAIFIENPFMGLRVILDGYSGLGEEEGFCLYVEPYEDFSTNLISRENIKEYRVLLDDYLYSWLIYVFKDDPEIIIDVPVSNFNDW